MPIPKYTLITGASEGLGRALALEFAKRKMNLILVALPGVQLYHLSQFIEENYKVKVIAIEKDLCETGSAKYIFRMVTGLGLQVNMLVNNAGLGSTLLFEDGSEDLYEYQVKLNVLATTLITRNFLDMLKSNDESYILNVGSLSSYFNLPKKPVYSATKSYIYSFSRSLSNELRPHNIRVTVLCPGGMNTNTRIIALNKSISWLPRQSVMEPEDVASLAVDGLLAGKRVIVPGRLNRFLILIGKIMPAKIKDIIAAREMRRWKIEVKPAAAVNNNFIETCPN